jgi:cytochrome bd-type quinol oxidase subunit 2
LVVYTIFAVVVSLIWTNNRLRDSGLASEGWRVFLIILSILSGIVGCIVLLYCSVKPTEYPSELTVEDDDDCRDEGPR